MAHSNHRLDEMRFRNAQSPRDDPSMNYTSPFRPMSGEYTTTSTASYDPRQTLQRRFTTNGVPPLPLSPIGLQRRQAAESSDMSSALEKKKKEFEMLKEQRRRFETEMKLLDLKSQREADELQRLSHEVSFSNSQSEPTTPPDHHENGFPTSLSRPSFYTTKSILSPNANFFDPLRASRSGSQVHSASQSTFHLPSKSVPASGRNSDEEEDNAELTSVAGGVTLNRSSLPLVAPDHRALSPSDDSGSVTDYNNVAASLLDDETSLQMDYTKDRFPTLVRRSTLVQPLDSPKGDKKAGGWPSFPTHRKGQKSMPSNVFRNSMNAEDLEKSQMSSMLDTPTKASLKSHRFSVDLTGNPSFEINDSSMIALPPSSTPKGSQPKITSSFSTSSIPTLKGMNGGAAASTSANAAIAPKTHAEQHYHNHNASIGRIPPNASSNRNSHDNTVAGDMRNDEMQPTFFYPRHSGLYASVPPMGPTSAPNLSAGLTTIKPKARFSNPGINSTNNMNTNAQYTSQPAGNPGHYGGYGLPMHQLAMGVNNATVGGAPNPQWNQMQAHMHHHMEPHMLVRPAQNPIIAFGVYARALNLCTRPGDSQQRIIQLRRQIMNDENTARFAGLSLDHMKGHILVYCKDQHGCRYLQAKLEEDDPDQVKVIFDETKQNVVELMQDPFGNYLIQKMLEHVDTAQRTELIKNAAPEMTKIAVNQHGTRALQKMIEHVTTNEQVGLVILALSKNVIGLIQDINGNHVIQKCLNHLSPSDLQFIFDAVGEHCVVVGTHRHGCCVIQRCVDHARGTQKAHLVSRIIANAFTLVQDPFGNYVVQYIIDMGVKAGNGWVAIVCTSFLGKIGHLSKQKFSSNVMEKCLRVADSRTLALMVQEMMSPTTLPKIVNDPYGNYVLQTAIEHTYGDLKDMLMAELRKAVVPIRYSPHGRRFTQRIMDYDNFKNATMNVQRRIEYEQSHVSQQSSKTNSGTASQASTTNTGFKQSSSLTSPSENTANPQTHRPSNPTVSAQLQAAVLQQQKQHQSSQPGYARSNHLAGLGNGQFL